MFNRSYFGVHAFAASVAAAGAQDELSLSDFTPAEQCGVCPTETFKEWQTSGHSQAAKDPLFWLMLPAVARDVGEGGAAFCLTCHAPLATVTKAARLHSSLPMPLKLEAVAMEGVTCDFCHTISGEEYFGKDIGPGIYRYPRKGQTSIKYGLQGSASTPNHPTQQSKILRSGELCSICHKFGHFASGETWQDTYEEWKSGPYPGLGIGCNDCHLPECKPQTDPHGVQRKGHRMHDSKGGHSELVKKTANVSLRATISQKGGQHKVKLKALVTNVGSGHLMPTGIPGIRQMWLEVTVRNARGAEVFTGTAPIGIELLGHDGKPTMPWNAVRLGKDTRIGPRKSRQTTWEFAFPTEGAAPLRATVTVFYRSISELAAKTAGIQPSTAVEMATDRVQLFPDGRVERIAAE